MVMATVLALVAGGFRIVTRPMERIMARTMRTICVMWTRNFQVSSKERIEDRSCILLSDECLSLVCTRKEGVGSCPIVKMVLKSRRFVGRVVEYEA